MGLAVVLNNEAFAVVADALVETGKAPADIAPAVVAPVVVAPVVVAPVVVVVVGNAPGVVAPFVEAYLAGMQVGFVGLVLSFAKPL